MTSANIITFIKKVINTKEPINTENDIINTKLIFEILIESDFQYFYNKLNLTFDQSFGILFTELSESLVMINTYISKSGVSLSFEYDNIKEINIGKLLNKDEFEIEKLLNLLVILMLNSSQKDTFIDILLSLDEDIQEDVLNIIEKYIVIDRVERESIKHDFNMSPNKNENKKNKEVEYQVSHLKEEIALLQKENKDSKLLIETHEENIKELEKKNVILTLENNDMKSKLSTFKNQENYEKKQSFNNNDSKFIISNLNAEIKELNSIRSQMSSQNEYLQSELDKIRSIYESSKLKIDMYETLKDRVAYYENVIKSTNKEEFIEIMKSKEKEIKQKDKQIQELTELLKSSEKERISINSVNIEHTSKDAKKENNINLMLNSNKKKAVTNFLIQQNNEDFNFIKDKEELKVKYTKEEVIDKYIDSATTLSELTVEYEYLKKEILDLKDNYNKEFELISSCIYNLGVQFIVTKQDFNNKMRENPPWLIKERQKFFNGDI